jgi:hypothetical protein
MAVKYYEWSKNIPAFSFPRPSKIYPNMDFWFENKPSGNPVRFSRSRNEGANPKTWEFTTKTPAL